MPYRNDIPHGIMFHHFHDGKHIPSQGSISSDDLKKLLEHIGIERFLSPDEWLEKLAKKELKNEDLCLTFDDGLLSQADVALPVLEHYKLKAFWFVYSGVFEGKLGNLEIYRFFRTKYFKNIDDFYNLFFERFAKLEVTAPANPDLEKEGVRELRRTFPFYSENDAKFRFLRDQVLGKENYENLTDSILEEYGADKSEIAKNLWMSDKDLRQLNNSGHLIGLHSYSHSTALADLSFQEQFEEYQKNYSHLEEVCGKKPVAMAHPCNSYSNDTLAILKQLGIGCGFRSNMFPKQDGGRPNVNDLEIAREDHANIIGVLG